MLKTALERDQQARPFENVIRQFGEIVLANPELLARLDETPDKDSFVRLYLSLAKEHGCVFSQDELLIAVQEQKQGSNWVIPRVVVRMIADRF